MIYYLRDSNSGLIGVEYNGTTYYYEKNAQDDVTKILDGEFNVVAKYEYDAWGNVISIKDNNGNNITDEAHIGNINPFRYRSYYYDQEIGMYYLNSRYYNPLWGRFINADGILNGNKDIKGLNLYSYVGNNPVNNTDSEGDFFKKLLSKVKKISQKILKTLNTLVTYGTQPFLPKSSEMMRESLIGDGKLNKKTEKKLINSIKKSTSFQNIVEKAVKNARVNNKFYEDQSSRFGGLIEDLHYSVGKYYYELSGKKATVDNKLGFTVWEIDVHIWDDYDYDYEGYLLNYYGAFMQNIGVINKYRWDINFKYFYVEK